MSAKSHVLISIFCTFCLHHLTNSAPSLQCTQDIASYIAGITPLNPKLWAIKSKSLSTMAMLFKTFKSCSVLDSSAKFPADGLLQGTFLMQMGHYDQCLATKGPEDIDGEPKFTGQYCRVQVGFKTKENNTDARTQLLMAQMKIVYDLLNQTNTQLMPGGADHYLTESLANQKVSTQFVRPICN
jgi:Nose resistant-to-fluoxetine protein, N-terminal domain